MISNQRTLVPFKQCHNFTRRWLGCLLSSRGSSKLVGIVVIGVDGHIEAFIFVYEFSCILHSTPTSQSLAFLLDRTYDTPVIPQNWAMVSSPFISAL